LKARQSHELNLQSTTDYSTRNSNICTYTQHLEQAQFHHFIIKHGVKYAELFKHIKIMEDGPTCFGLQRNHLQGATASA